jgi:hypothetical protein
VFALAIASYVSLLQAEAVEANPDLALLMAAAEAEIASKVR